MSVGLLGLQGMGASQVEEWVDRAFAVKGEKPDPVGGVVAPLFYEPSTRTQASFEIAARRLGMEVLHFSVEASSVRKGEDLLNTARTLEQLGAECLILRHPESFAPHRLAERVSVPVINAGDGTNEHPTQALLDVMTLKECFGGLRGLRIAIVGDVAHSRVAHSTVYAFRCLGARLLFVGPRDLWPSDGWMSEVPRTEDLEGLLSSVDVVYLLRMQVERHGRAFSREAYRRFQIDEERMERGAFVVMHPGPANVGVEITQGVIDHPRSLIGRQVQNGVFVRMAVLEGMVLSWRRMPLGRPA